MLTSLVLPAIDVEVTLVCSAPVCTHDGVEQRHDQRHVLCEHCTVGFVECGGCELVLVGETGEDDEDGLRELGWVRTENKRWMCPTCSTYSVAGRTV
jgi:hypothetical protein